MIRYSPAADRWFRSLGDSRHDAAMDMDESEAPAACSWLLLRLDKPAGKTLELPIFHGGEGATIASTQYMVSLPTIWERLGVKEMTVLQSLEVKARALVMGDIVACLRPLIEAGLIERGFTGSVDVRNPYHFMNVKLIERLEAVDPTVDKYSRFVPKRWHDKDTVDRYDIRGLTSDDGRQGIGMALHKDLTDVPAIDLAGSLALLS